MRLRNVSISAGFVFLVSGIPAQAQKAQVEAPRAELAAQVRTQGFVCDKALGVTRDKKRSRPDYAVWVLKCSNAVYGSAARPICWRRFSRCREHVLVETAIATPTDRHPRECGGSSTPRLLQIQLRSLGYWVTRLRG